MSRFNGSFRLLEFSARLSTEIGWHVILYLFSAILAFTISVERLGKKKDGRRGNMRKRDIEKDRASG